MTSFAGDRAVMISSLVSLTFTAAMIPPTAPSRPTN